MLLQFIDAMKTEHERRTSRQVSTRNELYSLYQDSFSTPQDIAFIHLWSSCRSADLPELADLQGRLYAVRDLRDDLARGIFFIPGEVIEQSGLDADKLIDNPQLADTNECVQAWRRSELVEGAKLIEQLGEKELDWKARLLVKFLTK